jgi:starch-binding outer membrane protein, SusD/RagB family
MNTRKILITFAIILGLLQGCRKDLNLVPKDQLTVSTTFVDYKGFQTYSWQFYSVFPGYSEAVLSSENNSDLFENANPNGQSPWAFQLITIPSTSEDFNAPYRRIRAINIMLDQIEGSKLTDLDKKHWRGVGYYFRAINYMDLLNKYGAVPLILRSITDADKDLLFGPRTSRDSVANQILSDLAYAEVNIKTAGDGNNTIKPTVVRATISRFGLREGTWRKYQGLSDAQKFLRASADASEKLLAAFPSLANFDLDFNSNSLAGVPGIILYKQYESNQIMHVISSRMRQSVGRWDLTKKAADMFLMTDGQTRFTSPLFQGDRSPYTEYRSRDRRMLYSTPPPFKVNVSGQSWTHTGVAADAEYFPVMAAMSDDQHKNLPTANWAGIPVISEPHFADDSRGQAFCVTYTGYRFYRFANKIITGVQNLDVNDYPIFRMGEILANHAEAKFELGEFNQGICDITINKLRARGGVANLNIGSITADPGRDATVDPVLWEIRRERAIELMGEGFRFDDLRRWKKLHYILERKTGRWIVKGVDVSASAPIPIIGGGTSGYIAYEPQPPTSIPDYYYLYPLPTDQLVLNPQLAQNPGWK